MKAILVKFVALCLLGIQFSFAQESTIRGKVVDRNNNPLDGANIYLKGTILGSASDRGGLFLIRKVPTGRFNLTIHMIGFGRLDTLLSIESNQQIDLGVIILSAIPLQSEPIVVTASKHEQYFQDIPLSISSVSAQEINYRNSITIDKALKYVSGVAMNRDQVNIRSSNGYSYGVGSRVMMLVDGIPLVAGDTQGLIFESLAMHQIERIEIQKGAGSTLYGSNALGGVINVLTRSISEEPELYFKLYGGTYDEPYHTEWDWSDKRRYLHGLRFGYSQKIANVGWRLAISRDEDDSYRKNDWRRRYNFGAKLQFDLSPFDLLSVTGNYMNQDRENFLYWQDLNNALIPASNQLGDRVDAKRYFINAIYRHIMQNKDFYRVNAIWYRNRFADNIDEGHRSLSDFVNFEFQYTFNVAVHMITAGITPSYNYVDSDLFGVREGYAYAVYIQDEIVLGPRWQTTLGVRFDYFKIDSLSSDNSINPKLGLIFKPQKDLALRASVGTGFRAPSISEAFTTTTAEGIIVVPNPELKAERSISAELGWNQIHSKRIHSDLALFYNYFKDLIEAEFLSETENQVQFKNITKARVFGLEFNMDWQIVPEKLLYHIGYTFTNPRDLSSSEVLKYRPEHILYTDLKWNLDPFRIGLDYRYLSRFGRIDENFALIINDAKERVPIHVVDLRFLYSFTIDQMTLLATLQINNLLQYNYVDVIGTLAPLRNYVLTLETEF